ncbi:MAG: hypothetical protein AVDCRST_MAG13-3034, partial [uncultured Solirubrobacteraceae bacterium]
GERLGLPPPAAARALRAAGADRARRGDGGRLDARAARAGDEPSPGHLRAARGLGRRRPGARLRPVAVRVEGRGVLPRRPGRRPGGARGGLGLPGPRARLRGAARPRLRLSRPDGRLLPRRGGGPPPGGLLLRRLDHVRPRRAVQGRAGHDGLV